MSDQLRKNFFNIPKLLKENPIVKSIELKYSENMEYFEMILVKRNFDIFKDEETVRYITHALQLERIVDQNIILKQVFQKLLKELEST